MMRSYDEHAKEAMRPGDHKLLVDESVVPLQTKFNSRWSRERDLRCREALLDQSLYPEWAPRASNTATAAHVFPVAFGRGARASGCGASR